MIRVIIIFETRNVLWINKSLKQLNNLKSYLLLQMCESITSSNNIHHERDFYKEMTTVLKLSGEHHLYIIIK